MQQDKDRATDEAMNWLIALREDQDDTDLRARFETWLAGGSENRRAWKECQYVWDALGAVEGMTGTSAVGRVADPATEWTSGQGATRPPRSWRRPLMAGAAGAMAICLAFVLQPAFSLRMSADYATGVAQTREIKLEDGSTVYLGADSAISVSFETTSRKVTLLSGEAYFDVAPNPARPFSVETDNVETRVIGTGFNVRRSTTGVNVAVNHGRVAVSNEEAARELDTPLTAGDWVDVSWDGKVQRGNDAPELAGGWRSGMLVVKDRPVADVINEIDRHYKGRIVTVDSDIGSLRVTGVYDLTHPVEALNAVVQAHGAHVREITPWVAVVSRW